LAEVCRPSGWLSENGVYSNMFTHFPLRITRHYLSAHLRTPPSVYFVMPPWFLRLLMLHVRHGTCHPVAVLQLGTWVIGKLADIDGKRMNSRVQCATPRCNVCGDVMYQDECFEPSSFILCHYFAHKFSKELY